ncbi:MAG: hypothetical protein GYB41_16550 [Oceanospirillales bacterium]|uniref:Lipoprotein n=1 Tax=Marinobacterium halophilum TaxID=267374 RepID=A0A2P8EZU8_9GAMM|nr:hypothetical protein [Marinobacterium halophilum]MBR9830219.1 hypothetical protein [Oceanospirillales bacterium]PSL14976.1 hypothetical protein CLV44_106156 [Marinobacterium halophilum]
MKKALTIFCLASVALNANAGVQEKKALRAAEQNIATAITDLKSACGNPQLEASIAWDAVDEMATKNADIIQEKGIRPAWIYTQLSDRTVATAEALSTICKDDADYKEAIAEMTHIVVEPKEKYDDYKSEFSLDGTTLTITNGWYMTRSASDFRTRLLDLY